VPAPIDHDQQLRNARASHEAKTKGLSKLRIVTLLWLFVLNLCLVAVQVSVQRHINDIKFGLCDFEIIPPSSINSTQVGHCSSHHLDIVWIPQEVRYWMRHYERHAEPWVPSFVSDAAKYASACCKNQTDITSMLFFVVFGFLLVLQLVASALHCVIGYLEAAAELITGPTRLIRFREPNPGPQRQDEGDDAPQIHVVTEEAQRRPDRQGGVRKPWTRAAPTGWQPHRSISQDALLDSRDQPNEDCSPSNDDRAYTSEELVDSPAQESDALQMKSISDAPSS